LKDAPPGGTRSVAALVDAAVAAARRFPLVVATAFVACGYAVWLVGETGGHEELTRVLLSVCLGYPLFLGIALSAERYGGRVARATVWLNVGAFAAMVLHFLWTRELADLGYVVRYTHLAVILFAALAFVLFLGSRDEPGFWRFNRALIVRGFVSLLYSVVFFAGVSIAIHAIHLLFEIKVEEETYQRVWCVAAFLLYPWHFVAGIPRVRDALAAREAPPAALRVFAQYLLVPLATGYILILYAYAARIIVRWDWPHGTVAWLVTGLTVLGTFTYLCGWGYRGDAKAALLRGWFRAFYWAMAPVMVLHLLGVARRIADYGVTENRYFLVAMGVWMLGLCAYFVVGRRRDLRAIPVSLAAVAAIVFAGPWGAYAVSCSSQVARLEGILARNGMIADGAFVKARRVLPERDLRGISSVVDYLDQYQGLEVLRRRAGPKLAKVIEDSRAEGRPRRGASSPTGEFMSALGLRYVGEWTAADEGAFHYYAAVDQPIGIVGWDFCVDLGGMRRQVPIREFRVSDRRCEVRFEDKGSSLWVVLDGFPPIRLPLAPLAARLRTGGWMNYGKPAPVGLRFVTGENASARVMFVPQMMDGEARGGMVRVESVTGLLFIKLKP